jgi:hypothetical protein
MAGVEEIADQVDVDPFVLRDATPSALATVGAQQSG